MSKLDLFEGLLWQNPLWKHPERNIHEHFNFHFLAAWPAIIWGFDCGLVLGWPHILWSILWIPTSWDHQKSRTKKHDPKKNGWVKTKTKKEMIHSLTSHFLGDPTPNTSVLREIARCSLWHLHLAWLGMLTFQLIHNYGHNLED